MFVSREREITSSDLFTMVKHSISTLPSKVVDKIKPGIWSSLAVGHRLRPKDTHPALYTMLYNNSAKCSYAEPVHNKTMKFFKIRD